MTSGLSGSTYEEKRERLDSIVWRKEGRYDSSLENPCMNMIMWIKTNGLAQPMYLVKMKDKPECPVIH